MRHLMRYEGYTSKERLDDILDKISKYGINSLNQMEKDFLDSHSTGKEEQTHQEIAKQETEKIFEDDQGYFKFEHLETEDYGDEIHYVGILYVPDLELETGQRVEGRLKGKIVVFKNGQVSPDFYSIELDEASGDHYDVFEFCNGLEYELDSFLDYVVGELDEKN